MTAPRPKIDWIGSPNFRSQSGVPKLFWVDHWMVGNMAGTDRLFQSSANGVATQFGIEEGVIHQYVDLKDYAFGTGDTYANAYGIAAEHAGGWLNPDGSRYTPNAATMESSAQALAYVADLYGWAPIQYGVNQFIHSNFVSTECPGTTPFEARNRRAQQIRDGVTGSGDELMKYFVESSNGGPSGTKLNGVLFGPGIVERTKFGTDRDFIAKAVYGVDNRFISTKQVEDLKAMLLTSTSGGGGFTLAQLVDAFDKADDASTAQIITALGNIKVGATPAEFLAALKSKL